MFANGPSTHAQNDNSGYINVSKDCMSHPTCPILLILCQGHVIHFYSIPFPVNRCLTHLLYIYYSQASLQRAKPVFPTVYSICPNLNSVYCLPKLLLLHIPLPLTRNFRGYLAFFLFVSFIQ